MYPNYFASVPLRIFLAEAVYNHALLKLLTLIIDLPLSLLGDLEKFFLDFTVNEHRDSRQNYIEVVLFLEYLLDEGAEGYGVSGFV